MSEWAAKRFWTETMVVPQDGGFGIELDGRPVRTPAKAGLVVPSEAMAQAVAAEWDAQGEKIDPSHMPMTRSANAALDKVIPQQAEVAAMLCEYGSTDLLCYRAESPAALVARQAEAWDPLLDWAREALEAPLTTAAGVMYVAQPETSLAALRRAVDGLDAFELTALHDLVSLSGSLVIGLAAARAHQSAPELWPMSRIDETFQAEQWGVDEEAAAAEAVKRQAFEHSAEFLRLHREGGPEG